MNVLLLMVGAYLVLLALLWLLQARLVFPGAGYGDRGLPHLPGLELGSLRRPNGEEFRTVAVQGDAPQAVVVLFGGNGEDLYSLAGQATLLSRHGLLVIAAEYPGYGASQGAPTVASILECADVTAELGLLRAKQLGIPLMVAGSSLGSFPAVHLAARGIAARLLLRAPPTTLAAAATRRFFWLPVQWLLRYHFDSLALAPQVTCPTLVLHGDQDDTVPPELGRELAAAMPHARFELVPGCNHNNLDWSPDGPAGALVAAFLAGH